MFYHPKYYKELRKRNKLDQVISSKPATAGTSVHLVRASSNKLQAPSNKPQASSLKLQATVDTSNKLQAPSGKHQASSRKQQAPQ